MSFKESRSAPRKQFQELSVRSLLSLDHMTQITRTGVIINASKNSLLLRIHRDDLLPKDLKKALNLNVLDGTKVMLIIDGYDLELGGAVSKTKRITKNEFDLIIDISDAAPEYWRDCLYDMLPENE